MSVEYRIGDVFERMAEIPDGSIDLIATSPPFWQQRAYLPSDHPDKSREIGQEPTAGEFVATLLCLTAEMRRVVAPHGSIAIELGDTMSGSGGAGGDYDEGGFRDGQPKWVGSARAGTRSGHRHGAGGGHGVVGVPPSKSHCMIPEAYRLALAWGVNPLTGEPSPAGQWIVRNVVRWCRNNPTPGADGDKFRRATSEIVVATINPRRWWDGDAVRVPATGNNGVGSGKRKGQGGAAAAAGDRRVDSVPLRVSDGTRPLYDWWLVNPTGYSGAHYAVWTPEVAVNLIESMCPRQVCTTCGEPRRRIVERDGTGQNTRRSVNGLNGDKRVNGAVSSTEVPDVSARRTIGWTDCGHDSWRNGVTLDPFGGSGTTGMVASGLGRDAILIDLDARNAELARERVGMFLEVAS